MSEIRGLLYEITGNNGISGRIAGESRESVRLLDGASVRDKRRQEKKTTDRQQDRCAPEAGEGGYPINRTAFFRYMYVFVYRVCTGHTYSLNP